MLAAALIVGGVGALPVSALTSSSTHYQVDQTQFGSASTSNTCSSGYCAETSIGDPVAGQTGSSTKTASLGSVTGSEPRLEVVIEPGSSNLGVLTTTTTASKTTTIQVLNYLSHGYTLQIVGGAPTYGDHTLATPSTPTASAAGTEQFGINLALNTSPSVGAAPVQDPSSSTSFGVVNTSYNTPNLFMYSSGDVVAHSDSASGTTEYTVSMIVNISNDTPAGHYSGDFSAIVVPVY